MKHLLTIAGSDPSCGAGIQADLKTFSALGTYGVSVICAVTAQNTRGVRSSRTLDPEIIAAQLDAVFDDIRVDGVKIGMLADLTTIRTVAAALRRRHPPLVVLDPVMASKSGHRLLEPAAEASLVAELFPLATLVTPNLPEAAVPAGFPVSDEEAMEAAARRLLEGGAGAVLVKGGHREAEATDLLVDAAGVMRYPGPRLPVRHTHGTGCSLASAIAARAARERDIPIVFDPVGAGATAYRREIAERILAECRPTAVKGNAAEIAFLAGRTAAQRGVDSLEPEAATPQIVAAAAHLARRNSCLVLATGPVDVVSDGEETWTVRGGCPEMGRVCGSGCMAASVLASFLAVAEAGTSRVAAIMASRGLKLAGEGARTAAPRGLSSFRWAFMDALSLLGDEALAAALDADRAEGRLRHVRS